MPAPTLLTLPEELIAYILRHVPTPWHLEIKTRPDPLIETYYDTPQISALPTPPPLAPLLLNKFLSRIANTALLDSFTGTVTLIDAPSINLVHLLPTWQVLKSRTTKVILANDHRRSFLPNSMPFLRSLPNLRTIEFTESLLTTSYFKVTLGQRDHRNTGMSVPSTPDEISDEFLVQRVRLHMPRWPVDADDRMFLRSVEVLVWGKFRFKVGGGLRLFIMMSFLWLGKMRTGVRMRGPLRSRRGDF
ncbi:hypothetical protein PMZ80_001170 [Knufia obscura]|uniref:F-box domain-containing protein n=1 Tax=Knufia obscura TaxID=1635080 RepID=A0ABR0S2C8_9EURO|nr:hypothetical protein PMZ80_001170 [Knufia obscura]